MSTSGPYQSQLFNWVSRRSHRWQDQSRQALRQVKVAALWGVQLLLYPIYLLLQTRLGAKMRPVRDGGQIPEGAAMDLADEAALLAVDAPIQTVLQAIQICWDEESLVSEDQAPETTAGCVNPAGDLATFRKSQPPAKSTALAATQKLRGIATQLNSRTLVLVTAANQVLEILTPEQQQELQQRIVEELTRYGTQHRSMSWLGLRVIPLKFRPLRRRWQQLTAWVPRVMPRATLPQGLTLRGRGSPLKQQASLRQGEAIPNAGLVAVATTARPVLARIDRVVVGLEEYFQASFLQETLQPQRWGVLMRLPLRLRISKQVPGEIDFPQPDSGANSWRLRQLIQAAIDYFWGQSFLRSSVLSGLPATAAAQGDDAFFISFFSSPDLEIQPGPAWLTWSEVFGAHPGGQHRDSARSSRRSGSNTRSNQVDPQPARAGFIPATVTRSGTTEIETEAVFMGYDKHPLEQILQWLDKGLAWLERQIKTISINLWSFIQGLFGLGNKPEAKASAPSSGAVDMISK